MITAGRDLESICAFVGGPEPLDNRLGLKCGRGSEGAMRAGPVGLGRKESHRRQQCVVREWTVSRSRFNAGRECGLGVWIGQSAND